MAHPNRTLIHGCYRETVQVGGRKREFLTYIPKDLEYCQPCLVVASPSDADPLAYLQTSGLRQLAEEKQLYVHLMVSGGEPWATDGSGADFMNAVYVAIQGRDYYVTMQDNIYACGMGDGAVIAHQAAQKMASEWSGLFTFGALSVPLDSDAASSAQAQEQGGLELKIDAQKAQLPVWIAAGQDSANLQSAIAYWKAQNHAAGKPLSGQGADQIWMPEPMRKTSEVNEEQIAQVRVTLGNEQVSIAALNMVWSYIGLARRHRSFGKKVLRYFKDPIACGVTLHEMDFDGMHRLWYEYVPAACTSDKKWPLVLCMHGRGGTAETFFDISCMSTVAEERKFIAIFPQASIHQQKPNGLKNALYWNGSYDGEPFNDVAFIRSVVEDAASRLPVDRGRIYSSGQSSGGIMTDVLCNSASDLFAACASWSGMYHPKKCHRNYEPTEPITWYCYPDKQGVPMLTVGVVDDMAHANYPEESWISYDQFLCQFSKDEKGRLLYRGKIVRSALREEPAE